MEAANTNLSLLASAARAATASAADQTNKHWSAVHVAVNVSASTGASITPKIEGKDVVSGKYYSVLTGAAITSTGLTILKVGPGFAASANAAAADLLPPIWRVTVTAASTKSVTYSVGAALAL